MKRVLALFMFVYMGSAPQGLAQEAIQKTFCTSATGYESISDLRTGLLVNAKRVAVNELFGELITSSSKVVNFSLTEDMINAYSSGFVRISGDPVYRNGKNFGEACITINAYVTEEDKRKLEPMRMVKKKCHADASLTTEELKEHTKEKAIIAALCDYERELEGIDEKVLLPLVHNVQYLEAGFVPDSETYCVKFEGTVLPIEVVSIIQNKAEFTPPRPLVDSLPDSAFSASSFHGNDFTGHGPANSKFGSTSTFSNWSAASNDSAQWLQVDLGASTLIRAIGTKGRAKNYAQWVTSYKLSYSEDGATWTVYQQNGLDLIFRGNQDGNTEVRHDLPTPLVARYVRFIPVTWYGHITMRVEVYGVPKT